MKLFPAYFLTIIHYIFFGLLLLIFHVVQVVAYNIFGAEAHKKSVDLLNFALLLNFYTILCRWSFYGVEKLPLNKPLIVVSNHQSMWDAPAIVWSLRKHHIKFISKKELGKGLPSISYNLRKGGSVLIDRKDREQSIGEISKLGKTIEQNNYSVCIFAEGTRNKAGKMRPFKPGGIKTLLENAPSALVVPYVVHDNYKLHKRGYFPLGIGKHLRFSVLNPIDRKGFTDDQLIEMVEKKIKDTLGQG
ncbi:MAG: 1-acyl-sn-glycerol-3-phosphate acyltransferase [Bacteroidales bacterium]|nr:1-acyl-sn-glycerol-3-phosphate acyltransferase [Bacteroidales bacterium]